MDTDDDAGKKSKKIRQRHPLPSMMVDVPAKIVFACYSQTSMKLPCLDSVTQTSERHFTDVVCMQAVERAQRTVIFSKTKRLDFQRALFHSK